MCRQLTKCTRNVRTPAMKFAWRPTLFHVKSVSVHPNSGVRSGVRSFFVRTQVLYMRPLERRVSRYLRRWLGLPRSLSNIALYGNTCKLTLPLKSIEEEFKVLRAREVLQFRESADPKVSGAGVAVRTGRKWRAEAAVEQAESRLRHRVLVGTVARGRMGLGTVASPRFDKVRGKERRQLVQNEVRAVVEEERSSRARSEEHTSELQSLV